MELYMKGKPKYIKYFFKHVHREHPATRGRMHIRREEAHERGELCEEHNPNTYFLLSPKRLNRLGRDFSNKQKYFLKGGLPK